MTREELLALGLEADVVEKIIVSHAKAVQDSKKELKEANKKLETTQAQLSAATQSIKEKDEALTSLGQDSNTLKELKTENETLKQTVANFEQEKVQSKLDEAILDVVSKSKPRDQKLVMALIDKSEVKYEDGEVKNLEKVNEQISKLTKDSSYLFQGNTKPAYNPNGGSGGGTKEPETMEEAVAQNLRVQMGLESE